MSLKSNISQSLARIVYGIFKGLRIDEVSVYTLAFSVLAEAKFVLVAFKAPNKYTVLASTVEILVF